MKLSGRQEEILDFVSKYRVENGYSPSLREIAEAFGLASVATVHQHVAALQKKGYVKKDWNRGRSLELSEMAEERMKRMVAKTEAAKVEAAKSESARGNVLPFRSARPAWAESMEVGPSESIELPLLGAIAAGVPIEAIEGRQTVAVPADMVGRKETYVLKVRGNSMIGDGILDGDFVIVEKSDRATNGETVVALINNQEVTLKRFYIEADGVRLQPANPAMAPIYLKNGDFAIQGVMIGLLRKLRH
jgi:repressor LexA